MPTCTLVELTEILDPPVTTSQIAALIRIYDVPSYGGRLTGRSGRPANVYPLGKVLWAHAQEAERTSKQFTDSDWIGAALLARKLIYADSDTGEITWYDGERAEKLGTGSYGYVHVKQQRCAAHRIVWMSADGEIPPAIQVNHINQLRWDNRRVNLELVSFGNNIRHAHGNHYVNYPDAVLELAALPPTQFLPTTDSLTRAGGTFRHTIG